MSQEVIDLMNENTKLKERIKEFESLHCLQPDVKKCAKQWDADHQRRALEDLGLVEEFSFGCDTIWHVAEALVASRRTVHSLQERVRHLEGQLGGDLP